MVLRCYIPFSPNDGGSDVVVCPCLCPYGRVRQHASGQYVPSLPGEDVLFTRLRTDQWWAVGRKPKTIVRDMMLGGVPVL